MPWISPVVRYRSNSRQSRKYLGDRPILDIDIGTVTTIAKLTYRTDMPCLIPAGPQLNDCPPPHSVASFLSWSVSYLLGGLVVVFIPPRFPMLFLQLLHFPPASSLSLPLVRNTFNSNVKPPAISTAGKWLCSSTVKRFATVFW